MVDTETDFLSTASVSYYVKIVKNNPKADAETNNALFQEYHNGNEAIKELIIKKNLGLVLSVAKKYKDNRESLEFIDLIQEGIIGLLGAIKDYDMTRGNTFATVATTYIQNAIRRAIALTDREIRRPVNFASKMASYRKIVDACRAADKPIPSDKELMKALDISAYSLKKMKEDYKYDTKSLNEVVNDDGSSELGDLVEDGANNYDGVINRMADRSLLLALKKRLKPYQYYVLYMKNFASETLVNRDIASLLGVTHQAVALTENTVYGDLRKIIEAKGIEYLSSTYDEDISVEPREPEEIIKYFFFRNFLTAQERELYKLIVSKEYSYDECVFAKKIGVDIDTYRKVKSSLNKKITINSKKAKEAYESFRSELIKKYKTKIFTLDFDTDLSDIESNVKYVAFLWDSVAQEDALKIIKTSVSHNFNDLVNRYFNDSSLYSKSGISTMNAEREVNTLLFGYNKKSERVISGLYAFLNEKRKSFTDEEYCYLKMKLFHKISKEEFKAKYPSSKLPNNYSYLLYRLESMYFNITNYREYNFSKDKYIQIRDKAVRMLSQDKINVLDAIYGVFGKEKSISEIATNLGKSYEDTKTLVANARSSAVSLYLNRSRQRDIDAELYIPYILNGEYDIPDLTRDVLSEYFIDGIQYDAIAKKHNITKQKVSIIISSGIEKIDFYRFGIAKLEDKFTDDEIMKVFTLYSFDDIERKIITMKLASNTRDEMIKETGLTFEKIAYILDKFYKKCKEVKVSDVPVDLKDIEREVTCHISERVLNETERTLLAEVYGIKCDLNPEGIKYGESEYRKRHPKFSKPFNKNHNNALKNIKSKKIGLNRASSVAYMSRDELKMSLSDPRLPIDKKARELLCYSFELNGYPYKSLKELESIFNASASSLKQRIQRAFVTIFKYENDELAPTISYEYDVLPYLKYFAKADQAILIDLHRDNLTYEEIAKKEGLTSSQVENLVLRLEAYLHDLFDELVNGFDFDYFWSAIDKDDIPFYGDKEKAKRIFYLYYEERMSSNEIVEALNLDCNRVVVERTIRKLMRAVLKRKAGVKKVNSYEYEDVKAYYEKYSNSMDDEKRAIYNRYFENVEKVSQENYLSSSNSINVHSLIVSDLIKDKLDNPFIIGKTSKQDVLTIIRNNKQLLSQTAINTLVQKYDILPRELMSGSEQMKVLKYLSSPDNKDKILSLKNVS